MSLQRKLLTTLSSGLISLSSAAYSYFQPPVEGTQNTKEVQTARETENNEFKGLEKYGTVKFIKKPQAEQAEGRIYIVPLTHRDSLTGKIDTKLNIAGVNRDVYRIARYLIENKGLELIVREGWLASEDYNDMNLIHRQQLRNELGKYKEHLMNDDEMIAAVFGVEDPDYAPGKPTLDGITLLNFGYDVDIQGVEDAGAHKEVLRLMDESKTPTQEGILDVFRTKQANQVRSGKFLYNLPKIIEREKQAGRIKNKDAMMAVGVAHMEDIIRFVEDKNNKVYIFSQPHLGQEEVEFPLQLENYGVTIIEPNSLPEEYKINAR